MRQVPFEGRILVLGCGGVARCTVPLLLKHLDMPSARITIMDMLDCRDALGDALDQGVQFVREQIVPDRYGEQLARFVGPGDMIVDLAWNIDCVDLLEWCHARDVRYVNTSVELWDPYSDADRKPPTERTLYVRHMAIRRLIESWANPRGATAILEHGANPGLVSHFTKMGLLDLGRRLIADRPGDRRAAPIAAAMAQEAFNRLAQLVGLKVIHISECDTQSTPRPVPPDEFVNTWSPEGFFEEAIAPAEMGWGTHERELPADASRHAAGPQNQICLARCGMQTYVRSRVPSGEIIGMVIRHGESFSISEALTVVENGQAVYRPTVHYAYFPCEAARISLEDLRARNYEFQPAWRVMSNEIAAGSDELGCLLMGHDYKSWWTGSVLGIDEARRLVPGQNATTLQVAAAVMSAVIWMIRHPHEGVRLPDQLPHREIMDVALPYLGRVVSTPLDWSPGHDGDAAIVDSEPYAPETWQFQRFLVQKPPRSTRRRTGRRAAKRLAAYDVLPVSAGKLAASLLDDHAHPGLE